MINYLTKLIPILGIGLLAASELPAQVQYSGEKNIAFGTSFGIPDAFSYASAANTFKIDFNSDGVADVAMFRSITVFPFAAVGGLNGAHISGVEGGPHTFGAPPTRWLAGDSIGPGSAWLNSTSFGELNSATLDGSLEFGSFANQRGYIGVSIPLLDGIHYGWIDYESDITATGGMVFGWALEGTPDMAIAAGDRGPGAVPEPSTYALTGAAALGLLVVRRRMLRSKA